MNEHKLCPYNLGVRFGMDEIENVCWCTPEGKCREIEAHRIQYEADIKEKKELIDKYGGENPLDKIIIGDSFPNSYDELTNRIKEAKKHPLWNHRLFDLSTRIICEVHAEFLAKKFKINFSYKEFNKWLKEE